MTNLGPKHIEWEIEYFRYPYINIHWRIQWYIIQTWMRMWEKLSRCNKKTFDEFKRIKDYENLSYIHSGCIVITTFDTSSYFFQTKIVRRNYTRFYKKFYQNSKKYIAKTEACSTCIFKLWELIKQLFAQGV